MSEKMANTLEKYRYTGSKKFNIAKFDTADQGEFSDREEAVDEFVENLRQINKLQQKLYAERKEGVIFVFQAMDAAGKDGVIRTVFSTLSPHGVKEYCFKVPSSEESSHDYLWRFWSALPARGNISIFNRSYYEDVLVGKVHELYKNQTRPDRLADVDIIRQRYGQIKDFEKYLYNTGTRVVKIFLNVSKDEQGRRFVSRIDTPKKNWKISSGDISERGYWDEYMEAFEKMINTTSTKDSPWYVVPSDHKWYSRLVVSRIVLSTLEDMDPQYPTIDDSELEEAMNMRQALIESISDYNDAEDEKSSEFSKTGDIAADILYDEEQAKINEKKEQLKSNGFRAVREMLAKGYILKSTDEIIEAVADAESEEIEAPQESGEELPDIEVEIVDDGVERDRLLKEAIEFFGLTPTKKLSKDEKAFLKAISEMESDGDLPDFYALCDCLDIRPSKLDKLISKSVANEYIDIGDDGNVFLTDFGDRCLYRTKVSDKSEKKFRKFLKALNAEELEDFMDMCVDFCDYEDMMAEIPEGEEVLPSDEDFEALAEESVETEESTETEIVPETEE